MKEIYGDSVYEWDFDLSLDVTSCTNVTLILFKKEIMEIIYFSWDQDPSKLFQRP